MSPRVAAARILRHKNRSTTQRNVATAMLRNQGRVSISSVKRGLGGTARVNPLTGQRGGGSGSRRWRSRDTRGRFN